MYINFKRLLSLLGMTLVGFIVHIIGLGSTAGNFFWMHFGFLVLFFIIYGAASVYISVNKKKAYKLSKQIKQLKKDKKLKSEREKVEAERKTYLANAKTFTDILDMGVARSLAIGFVIAFVISMGCSLLFKLNFYLLYLGINIAQCLFDKKIER